MMNFSEINFSQEIFSALLPSFNLGSDKADRLLGRIQFLGRVQVLGRVEFLGRVQVLGRVQFLGRVQVLGRDQVAGKSGEKCIDH